MTEHELQCSKPRLCVVNWDSEGHVPLNARGMNLLGCKWYPRVPYWEDKPSHKAEDFRTKDKNLCWSPRTEVRSSAGAKSGYSKSLLLLPCYPRNTTTNSCFLLNFSDIHKIPCGCKVMTFPGTRSYLLSSVVFHPQKPGVALDLPGGRNTVTIFPAVKLAWFPNHNLTDQREAKGKKPSEAHGHLNPILGMIKV